STTAWTPFARICWNSPETARQPSDTIGRRQARRGASRSVTTFSRRPRDSRANCDQSSAIEFVALSAYHPAAVALFFPVIHLPTHRTSCRRGGRSIARGQYASAIPPEEL